MSVRADAPARPARPAVVHRPSFRGRLFGLGSIFGKGLRDSRRAILLAGLGLGLLLFFTASQVATQFATAEARAQMAALPQQLPVIFRGLLGEPINVATLGGFLSWRTINFLPVILGAWSLTALSGTLAAEAKRGSLDLVASSPIPRTRIALEKASAHVVAVILACAIIGILTAIATMLFATLPGDEVAPGAVAAHMAWLALMTLAPGVVAWVAAPIVGRGAAAGLGALILVASFVAHGYREAIQAFDALDSISYFGLTAGHRPIAGVSDWPSVAVLAIVEAGFLVLGLLVFRARDIGVTKDVSLPLPRLRLGLGGVVGRSFAERLSVAVWFGLGLGLMGLIYAVNAAGFTEAIKGIPQVQAIIDRFYPGVDLFTAGGVLQLVFFGFGALLAAGAAGMLANGWASDESDGRLEMVLAAPATRVGWALRSAVGVLGAIVVFTVIVAALVAVGVAAAGDDPTNPVLGSAILGGFTAALAGVGMAVGGLIRPSLVGPAAVGLGLVFYLMDVFGAIFDLPDWFLGLSLTSHLGRPMAGVFDASGIVACAVLAVGGAIVAAIGLRRRDVER